MLHRATMLARQSANRESIVVACAFHIPMTAIFLIVLFKSMSWETLLDTPMFMYSGFLMDQYGMAPMRDFFTYNMPGTHVIYRWLYHFFGGSILGMRLADTAVLAVILFLFAQVLRPFGWRVAWGGAVLFGLLHVTLGMHCYLQRDYIALVPLQLAILSASAWFEKRPRIRWLATGLFVGLLAAIKPHLMIGGLVLFAFMTLTPSDKAELDRRDWVAHAVRIAFWCCVGGSIPMLWMAGYLAYYGVLTEFITVLVDYFPLHADISGDHFVFKAGEKLPYIVAHFFDEVAWGHFQVALGAGAGIALFLAAPTVPGPLRRYGGLLAVLGLVYWFYPCIAARFYDHHYYTFRLLSTVWIAFCLYKWPAATPRRIRLCSLAAATYVVCGMVYAGYDDLIQPPSRATGYYRTQRIATWLKPRLDPGDTVQPIEWAFCGISHALLENKTKLATHTIWGEVFFHHVSNPFVVNLKKDFMEQLRIAEPRYIIRSKTKLDYVNGRDCNKEFSELDAFLSENYFTALESKDYHIWELNTSPTASEDRERYRDSKDTEDTDDSTLGPDEPDR